MHVLYTGQHRVLGLPRNDVQPGAELVVSTVMTRPGFSQDLSTKAELVWLIPVAVVVFLIGALEPIEGETRKMRPLTSLFYYPLALAFILSLGWALVHLLTGALRQLRLPKKEVE